MDEFNYTNLCKSGTGGTSPSEETKTVEINFDRYMIKVVLSQRNEFIGINEVRINKDFLSYANKLNLMNSSDNSDVESYYIDIENE